MIKSIIKTMSKHIKELFHKHLVTEREGVLRDRSVRRPEPAEFNFPDGDEAAAFDAGLDNDSVASDFDTDDIGFNPTEVAQDNFEAVYDKVEQIDTMIKDLVDPKKDDNLTKLLSLQDRADSIGDGLVRKLQRPIEKASLALSEVKIILDQIASSEASLQKRVDALKSK